MAGPIRIAILANGRQARSEAALTARAYGAMGKSVSRTAKLVGGLFAFRALAGGAAAIGRIGSSYVSSLNKIQALTGSTDRQMGKLASRLESQQSTYARFGQTTGDAAAGMVELAKSGLTAQKALGAIRGTMTLAKAGELDVADASELVANTINTFNLKASKAAKIANALANAANISSADVRDVAESFKYVAPIAAKAGASLVDVNALLAELANAGIKGSQAGTTLRSMFVRLQAPTTAANMTLDELGVKIFDASGKMKSMRDVIAQLGPAISKLKGQDKAYALKNLFGLNAITGAQEILARGVKTFDKYTAGVKRAGAASKLAASASKGLAGTWSSLKAQATSTVQELYRRFSPALDARLQSVADYLADNKDEMIATGIAAAKRLGPALETLAGLAKSAGEAMKDTAIPIAQDLMPAIEDLLRLAKSGAEAINDLPGPVKEIGVQAGIAALILPRLTASVTGFTGSLALNIARLQQWRAEMTYAETRSQNLATAFSRMGAAARTAAGIGGMVALAQSSGQSNEALSGLLRTAGLAATGFAVGGPLGAALGGVAGVGWQLYDAFKSTDTQMGHATETAANYAATLDDLTGKITEQTRQLIIQKLQQDGIIASASQLGLTTRDLVQATLGNGGAIKRVNDAYQSQQYMLDALQANKITDWIYQQGIALKNQRRDVLDAASGYSTWKQALHGIPKDVIVRLRNLGFKPTMAEFRNIRREANLTPKQVRIIVKALGFDPAIQGARKTGKALDDVGRKKGNLTNWQRGLMEGLTGGQQQVHRGVGRMNNDLDSGVRQGASKAAGTARSGGSGVGGALQSGIMLGFAGTAAQLAAAAASAVRQAIAAARAAADAHSPSREMFRLGRDMGDGGVLGLRAREKAAHGAGKSFVEKMLRGVDDGSAGISKVLDRITHLIETKLDGKKQAGRRKALLKSLKDERAALVANGRAQDHNDKLLDKAISKYKALKQRADEFAKSIKSGFQNYGSIVGLGTTGGGTMVTLPAILSQLQARATVAQQFATVIKSLRSKLNKTSLRQLLEQAAGGDLEGALATAQAVAGGGASAITQINQLTQQIAQAGADLGEKMRKKFFGHGLQVAEGVVEGLKRREKKLDRVADRLAAQFVRQAQQGLHITAKPGTLPVNQTHSRTPALDAHAAARSSTAAPAMSVSISVQAAPGADGVKVGKDIAKALDDYFSNGGRAKVRWGGR